MIKKNVLLTVHNINTFIKIIYTVQNRIIVSKNKYFDPNSQNRKLFRI